MEWDEIMEHNLREGISALMEATVTANDLASKYGSGAIDVYATPAMIALMENTAKSCVDLHLPQGYSTVGIDVNVKHIKSTPQGMKVKCEVVLEKIEGKRLFFKVEAWDEKGKIGEGTHTRYIINVEEFLARLS